MTKFVGRSVLVAALMAATGVIGLAQKTDKFKAKGPLACTGGQNPFNHQLVGHCEMREETLPFSGGAVSIDGRQNGGVTLRGWDQNQVLVRARVQSAAPTAAEAEALAREIKIETGGLKIFANGPDSRRDRQWSTSYEVFVPRRADVSVETHNGGIWIGDVNGRLNFTALNGGVVLKNVGGTVRGSTTNGGLAIELTGDRWDGETLDVSTTNGGVVMAIPENYSAHLQTGTVNGSISVDFPVAVEGRTKQLAVNLGSGGATIKARTTNGGVRITRVTPNQ